MDVLERLKSAKTEAEYDAIERELGGAYIAETLAEVAEFWGCHEKTVAGWRSDGCPGSEGWYDLREVARWRVAKAEKRGGNETDESERQSRRKMASIKAERDQLKLDQEKNLLVAKADVLADMTEAFAAVRLRLEALPAEMVVGEPADTRDQKLADWRDKITLTLKELESIGR